MQFSPLSVLRMLALTAAVACSGAANSEPVEQQPDQEEVAPAEEIVLPEGAMLDLSTPTLEELQAAKRARVGLRSPAPDRPDRVPVSGFESWHPSARRRDRRASRPDALPRW